MAHPTGDCASKSWALAASDQPRISRRGILREVACCGAALSLAGCGLTEQSPSRPEQHLFSNEPFPVRRVDRARFDPAFRPTRIPNSTGEEPGTILVNTAARHLHLVTSRDEVLRYGIAVGATGYSWKGRAIVGRKAMWPAWYPTDEMKKAAPGIPARIPPGDDNPLGARALYLYQNGRDTLYRIHGTSEPWTIGTEASSGCIRMFNEDVIDVYDRVRIGTRVIVT